MLSLLGRRGKVAELQTKIYTVDGKNRTRLLPLVPAGLTCFYGVSGGAISGRNERFFNISTVLDS